MHVQDLKKVLDQIGFNFRFKTPGGELHYQDICPQCRRRLFALNQGRALGAEPHMAIPTLDETEFIDKFGPHLNHEPPGGWLEHKQTAMRSWSRRIAAFAACSAAFS
jgi:hypothetical protein